MNVINILVLLTVAKVGMLQGQTDCRPHMLMWFSAMQFPMTALREIRILKLLKHENVVNLVEICRSKREHQL